MKLEVTVEYMTQPLGIDERKPAISWKFLAPDKQNLHQTAYRIVVSDKCSDVWDSTRRHSDQSIHIRYEGEPLKPFTKYMVDVIAWDEDGQEYLGACSFETGMLDESGFHGQWITHPAEASLRPIPAFTREFQLRGRLLAARVYATACGVYEIRLNGGQVGDQFFAPGWTAYQHRLLYQTYDVTAQLKSLNRLEVLVANGWYKGIIGFQYKPNFYGDRTALRLALHLVYEDGDEWIGTDESWFVSTCEIAESEIYNGESIDLTAPTRPLGHAVAFDPAGRIGEIRGEAVLPVRVVDRLSVREKIITPKGEVVLDFGQNLTGVVEVRLPRGGGEIVLRHAETLDKDGNFYTENLRKARATDTIRFGEEHAERRVMPRFTFHGFRYLAVEGVGADVDVSRFTACVLSTDTPRIGDFHCSNAKVNRLQSNIFWGARGNFLDIPTDCPQRDERLGWTGDAQAFSSTAAFNMDTALFFRKWLRDLYAEQDDAYGPPHVVPNVLGNIEAGAGWCDSVTIIPWNMYKAYGDKRFLEEAYPCMVRYIEYIRRHSGENLLWQSGMQYGDWLALDHEPDQPRGMTDQYMAANAYYLRSLEIVFHTAQVLGLQKAYEKYFALYQDVRRAFQKEYITETGRIVSETQTGCILPLQFNLVNEKDRKRIVSTLVNNIVDHRMHLTTGFMGTPYICPVLSDNGRHDIATQLFLSEEIPSWLYEVNMGATTIWERWDSVLPDGSFQAHGMNSLNHYANGSIGHWMYTQIAGIQVLEPGYRRIRLAPKPTVGIWQAEATLETPYGMLRCSYTCRDGRFVLDAVIPPNTAAEIILPGEARAHAVGSGCYHYEVETALDLRPVKYSRYTPVKDIVTQPLAQELLNRDAPGTLDSPVLNVLWEMPVFKLVGVMPTGSEWVIDKVIGALNDAEAATDEMV